MISAADALLLPHAQLTSEELAQADALEAEIDAYVREHMACNGVDFETSKVTDPRVIAVVNQRLKRAGWLPQWQSIHERHALNKSIVVHLGFKVALAPGDDAWMIASVGARPIALCANPEHGPHCCQPEAPKRA